MTIGALAKKYGVNREAIRFYERQGLLPKTSRTVSGYRLFDEQSEKSVAFILRAKELGFTLKEIKELLSLRVTKASNCSVVKKQADTKIQSIDRKIDYLVRMKQALIKLTKSCDKRAPTSSCPIIETLES